MPSWAVVLIAIAIIVGATYVTAMRVLPTEAYAAILGAFTPSLALVIQRNAYADAIQKSIRPPPKPKGDD